MTAAIEHTRDVKSIMTKGVRTVDSDQTVYSVLIVMSKHDIGSVVVTEMVSPSAW